MATTAGSQPKLPTGKGCFKCGKTGHWSRDCTAPPSEWITRPPTQPAGDGAASTQTIEPPQDVSAQLQVPVATGKRKRQKPKLTVDNLKEQHGIAEVFHTFPKLFKQQFRGRGHEAGDLRRLLELYIGWQQRIFPYASFDAFVEGLEKLGSSHVLKLELRELRSEVLKVVEEPKQGGWMGMGTGSDAMADRSAEPGLGAEDDAGMPDWDDDDLVAMQAEPMEVRHGPSTSAQPDAEMELDDDELLDMMGDMPSAPPPRPPNTLPPVTLPDDEFDDEELLELAQAGMSQDAAPKADHGKLESCAIADQDPAGKPRAAQSNAGGKPSAQEAQAPARPADVQQPANAAAANDEYLDLDDDELLELACASMDPTEQGITRYQDAAKPLASAAVGMSGSSPNAENHPAKHTQAEGPSSTEAGAAETNDKAHHTGKSEYELDDDELLALAATQLDGQ